MTDLAAQENTLLQHVSRTLALAWPMVLSRVGIVTMTTMDIVVLGRANAGEMANYVLGLAVQEGLIAMMIGLLLGVPVLVARETGAQNHAAAGVIWRRGLSFAAVLGILLCIAMQFGDRLLLASGQNADLVSAAARVTSILGLSLPFIAVYYVCTSFLEAIERPMVGLISIGIGNVFNLGLNMVLVFGAGPIPPLGALGCAYATVATMICLAISVFLYVRYAMRDSRKFGIGLRAPLLPVGPKPSLYEQFRIGMASGGSYLFEASASTAITLFIGLLGAVALATHGVLFQFLAFTFMVAYGIAVATQVRVGNAWGRNDPKGAALAGWTGLGVACVLTGVLSVAVGTHPQVFLSIFTEDVHVVHAGTTTLVWVLLATVFDGGQSVMNNACRGRGDTWVPTAFQFGSYWVVMVPTAWYFALHSGMGLDGIYQGILFASVVSLTILGLRFHSLSYGRNRAELPPAPGRKRTRLRVRRRPPQIHALQVNSSIS